MPSTTHNLYLSDGTTAASLVSEDVYLTGYTPIPPRSTATGWQDVTESARIVVQAATTVLIQYRIREIEKLLLQGADRQRNPAQERVFVYLQLANESELWRSEILGGRVELDDSAVGLWNSRTIEATVIWTRRYYWEGEEEETPLVSAASLPSDGDYSDLSESGADTWGAAGGVSIQNCGANSWWESDIVTGSLPAGVRLVVQPGSQQPRFAYHIGQSVGVGPLFDHHYEAEDGSGGSQLPGSADTAEYSGGYYRRVSVSATSLTSAITMTVLAADLGYANGGRFEILLRYANTPLAASLMWLQARATVDSVEVWRGAEVAVNGYCLQSLGVLQLPPSLSNVGGPLAVNIVIYARVASGSANLDVDFMQLIPAMTSRKLTPISRATGYASNTFVVDDGLDDALYMSLDSGTDYTATKRPLFIGQGQRLGIVPGVRNRFYLLNDQQDYATAGMTDTAVTHTVRMFHRSRRTTI